MVTKTRRLVVVVVVASSLSSCSSTADSGTRRFGAFDVCKKFVRQRLKAPATASFPDYFEKDGDVVVDQSDDEYTVTSHVDAENVFGAKLRNEFTCVVRTNDGKHYSLLSLRLSPQ